MKRSELKQLIMEVIEESKVTDNKSKKKVLGVPMSINDSGNLIINGVEFFSDSKAGWVKKGEKGFSASSGAYYNPDVFTGQLQGRGFNAIYTKLKDGVINNASDEDILKQIRIAASRWGGSPEEYISEFSLYAKIPKLK